MSANCFEFRQNLFKLNIKKNKKIFDMCFKTKILKINITSEKKLKKIICWWLIATTLHHVINDSV